MESFEIIDNVSEKLRRYINRSGARCITSVISLWRRSTAIGGPRSQTDPFLVPKDSVKRTIELLNEEAIKISGKQSRDRILFLFRKLPDGLTGRILNEWRRGIAWNEELRSATYCESILYGTECIMKYGNMLETVQDYRSRCSMEPSDEELAAALQLFVICIIMRHEMFLYNSSVRHAITEPVAIDELLAIYNRRLSRHSSGRPDNQFSEVIIYPTTTRIKGAHEWTGVGKDNKIHILKLKTYCPIPINSQDELIKYEYIDDVDFKKHFKVSYTLFCRVWLLLNKTLRDSLAILWSDSAVRSVEHDVLVGAIERSDDYTETALGMGTIASILQCCVERSKYDTHGTVLSIHDCEMVMKMLTFDGAKNELLFVERPYVFYRLSPTFVAWDYLRHSALLRSLAREINSKSDAVRTRTRKGNKFEQRIIDSIKRSIYSASGFKGQVQLKVKGHTVGEIDIGFVSHNILVLIEAKNYQKSINYYLRGVDVSTRVQMFEEIIGKCDNMLKSNVELIKHHWEQGVILSGAIYVVCTEEAEFIASSDSQFWLDREKWIPRICMLEELLEFIMKFDVTKVQMHPYFVAFHPEQPA